MPNWGKGHRVIPFGLYTWMQDPWRHLALSFLTSDSGKTNKQTFKHFQADLQKSKYFNFYW